MESIESRFSENEEFPFTQCYSLDGEDIVDIYSDEDDLIFIQYNTNYGDMVTRFKNAKMYREWDYRSETLGTVDVKRVTEGLRITFKLIKPNHLFFLPNLIISVTAEEFIVESFEQIDTSNIDVQHIDEHIKNEAKQKTVLLLLFFFLSSISFLPALFWSYDWMFILSGFICFIFIFLGCAFYFATTKYRKHLVTQGYDKFNRNKHKFFKNKYSTIFDILVAIYFIGFSNNSFHLERYIPHFDNDSLIFSYLFILISEMFLVLNGKNFNYFYNIFWRKRK